MTIVPQIDRHVHANGMATDEEIVTRASRYKVTLPMASDGHIWIDESGKRFWKPDDIASFHHAYDSGVSLTRTPEDLYDSVLSHLILAQAAGCLLVEILSSGLNNCRNDAEIIPIFEGNMSAILTAVRTANHDTGIHATVGITAKRHLRSGVAGAMRLLDAYEAFRDKGLNDDGIIRFIDMAGHEGVGCLAYADAFLRATRDLGLAGSVHAGELNGVRDIVEATTLPGVVSFGHALSVFDAPTLVEQLYQEGKGAVVLFTSNEQMQGARFSSPNQHPAMRMFQAGILGGFGSDDPGMLGTSIANEYQKAQLEYGFTETDLFLISAIACRRSFASMPVKENIMHKIATSAAAQRILLPAEVYDLGQRLELRAILAALPSRIGAGKQPAMRGKPLIT